MQGLKKPLKPFFVALYKCLIAITKLMLVMAIIYFKKNSKIFFVFCKTNSQMKWNILLTLFVNIFGNE